MSNEIKIFNNSQFGNIRVQKDEYGEPLFCLAHVCRALEISDTSNVSRQVISEFGCTVLKTGHIQDSLGRIQEANFITEQQLYFVMNRSDKPNAKPFRMWVNTKVLPSIRKHGMYATPVTIENMIADPDFAISLLNTLKEERIARQQAEEAKAIAEKERDVYSDMVDDVMQDDHTYTATEIAKDLGLRSANVLNKWLVEIGFFYKSGKYYIPYSKYSQKGFTSHKLYNTGHGFNVKTIKFTNAGKIWIVEKWKAQHQLLLGL